MSGPKPPPVPVPVPAPSLTRTNHPAPPAVSSCVRRSSGFGGLGGGAGGEPEAPSLLRVYKSHPNGVLSTRSPDRPPRPHTLHCPGPPDAPASSPLLSLYPASWNLLSHPGHEAQQSPASGSLGRAIRRPYPKPHCPSRQGGDTDSLGGSREGHAGGRVTLIRVNSHPSGHMPLKQDS